MIWLAWRQFRVQALIAAAALAAAAILLGVTGPRLASRYAGSGIAGCHGGSCANAASDFLTQLAATRTYPFVYSLGLVLILAVPAILGIFWGAPLIARELETGTYRLAWNQSVTRTRWLTVKLALTGLAAMAVTEALSLMHAWWSDPISRAIAVGGSDGVFSGTRFSWLAFASLGRRGIREVITYQPASRYWPLQWIETGIFMVLALALAWLCFWWLGRRRT